jgi:hypothetical protein
VSMLLNRGGKSGHPCLLPLILGEIQSFAIKYEFSYSFFQTPLVKFRLFHSVFRFLKVFIMYVFKFCQILFGAAIEMIVFFLLLFIDMVNYIA